MENTNEIPSNCLGNKVLYKLTKEEQGKYNQTVAPAFIVRGWINEYSQEKDSEYRVGLNLKVMLDNYDMIQKFSVKRCKEYLIRDNYNDIPDGEYLFFGRLLPYNMSYQYEMAVKQLEEENKDKEKINQRNIFQRMWAACIRHF